MADLKISELTQLVGTDVAAGDQLPIVDSSASQTKRVTAEGLVAAGVKLIPDASIPLVKINTTTFLVPDGSITAPKLAANSVGTAALIDGAVTDAKISGPIGVSKLGNQAANLVLAGPATGVAAAPTFRALTAADLPKASATSLGAVTVTTGGGLVVDASGGISLSAVGAGGTSPVVTYDANGRVTTGRALSAADLPLATASAVGAVKPGAGLAVAADGTLATALTAVQLPVATSTDIGGVKPGDGLTVAADGALSFSNSVTAGTGTKITYDQHGLVTGSVNLVAADIPALDAATITSGTFGTARFEKGSVTQDKLADYAISYIQEATPPVSVGAHPIGELWFQESTARLSMWNGNSWMAVGQGSLSAENLRFCGLFAATTGQITAVTTFGTAAGLVVSTTIPAATNQLTGVYLVCQVPGTYSGVTYDAGDWILCMGQARGWERIDTLNSGGGGGGGTLDGLTDVTITTPATGDVLVYNGSAWVNGALPDPGTY